VNEVHQSANRSRSMITQIQDLVKLTQNHPQSNEIAERGTALISKLEDWEIHEAQAELPGGINDYVSIPNRLLSTQYLYLKGAVNQDPPVTRGAEARYVELNQQWLGIKADLDRITSQDLSDFNAWLQQLGIGHILSP